MQNRQRIPHFSSETICRTVTILGVSCDSGHGLGSDGKARLALFSPDQERFLERSRDRSPGSDIRAKNKQFRNSETLPAQHSCDARVDR